MTRRYRIECLGDEVTMIVDEYGVAFEGWDEENEEAWEALGGDPSPCLAVARAMKRDTLNNALLRYVEKDEIEVAKALIYAGANINLAIKKLPEYNSDPFHRAAENGDLEAVKKWVELGIDIDALVFGRSALALAARNNHYDVVQFLLQNGADINVQAIDGSTVLHTAVNKNMLKLAEFLVKFGANPDIKNQEGNTPLHLAMQNYGPEDDLTTLLLDYGADDSIENNDGKTPLYYISLHVFDDEPQDLYELWSME